MFPNASPHRTRQRTAAAVTRALSDYQSTVASWYDGTPRSISARIAACDRIIHRLTAAGPGYHHQLSELAEDRTVLANLKHSLLNAHQDRVVDAPVTRTAPIDESTRVAARAFVRANVEVAHVPSELGERARHHADRHGLSPEFVTAALAVGATVAPPKTASIPTEVEDFPDHGLFL